MNELTMVLLDVADMAFTLLFPAIVYGLAGFGVGQMLGKVAVEWRRHRELTLSRSGPFGVE